MRKAEIIIAFEKIIRFNNGKGVLLPAETGNIEFQDLRKQTLYRINNNPGMHEPHITLLHPRNATCTDNIFEQIEQISLPIKLTFKRGSLIEKEDGGQ